MVLLVEALSRHPAWRPDVADSLSVSDAVTLLFVSRPHVLKLLQQGELTLHHETGSDSFVTKASVMEQLATRNAAVEAYNSSTSDGD